MTLLTIVLSLLYIIIGTVVGNILEIKAELEEMCIVGGIFWPLVLPFMLFLKLNKFVRRIIKGEKYKKLLIFRDKSGTITINTKITGR